WGSITGGVDYFNMLDYDHFAFVIKGENSSSPIPAGGYKFTNAPISKDVQIAFSSQPPDETPSFTLKNMFPDVVIAGLPIEGHVLITNTGSAYIPDEII